MSANIFQQSQAHFSLLANSYHPHDLGIQFVSGVKFFICVLILWKAFELTFLKYRKRLTIEDRVQKKYRRCHGEFIEHYSEDQTLLMQTTITNTIKNTEVAKKESRGKGRRVAKKVSFNIQKNNYYQHETRLIDSDDEDQEIEQRDKYSEKDKEGIAQSIQQEELRQIAAKTFQAENKDGGCGQMEAGKEESKITIETEASSRLSDSDPNQPLKKDGESPSTLLPRDSSCNDNI